MTEYSYYDWDIKSHVLVPENAKELYNKYQAQDKENNLKWVMVTEAADGDDIWCFHDTKMSALKHELNVLYVFEKLKTHIYYMNHSVGIVGEVV